MIKKNDGYIFLSNQVEFFFLVRAYGQQGSRRNTENYTTLKTQQADSEFKHTHLSANYFGAEHVSPTAERSSELQIYGRLPPVNMLFCDITVPVAPASYLHTSTNRLQISF